MEAQESYNVDLGIAGEQVLEVVELKLDVYCPFIVYIDPDITIMNFSSKQCMLRIKLNNKCWRNCKAGKEIRESMFNSGELD